MVTGSRLRLALVLFFLSALLTVPAVHAQNVLGRLAGSVLDTSGGVLPGATVTLTNVATNQAQNAVTSSSGAFVFPALQPGVYKVVIELSGFKTATYTNVQVNVGQEYSITAKLEVGGISETVEVAASSTLVQTTTPEVSQTVQQKQVLDLPLPGRDMTNLIRLQAGVAGTVTRMNTGINGGRPTWTQITQDGINIQDNFIRTNSLDFLPNRPSSDNVSEFTITTSVQGADSAGGASSVRMVTPAGSNTLRGSTWWWNRDSTFAANTFFNNASKTPKPKLKRNQPGGRLGGPIMKNKLFFFGYYEAFRQEQAGAQNVTIPANADFGDGVFRYVATDGQLRSVNILQLTGQVADPKYKADVISKIPAASNVNNYDRGDSKAGRILNTAAYRFNQQRMTVRDYVGGRVDYELNSNHHFEGIFTWSRDTDDRPDLDFYSQGRPAVFTSSPIKRGVGAWRWLISPSMQNELRYGLNLAPVRFDSNWSYGTVRYAGQTGTLPLTLNDPEVNFLPQGRYTNTYQLSDNANWVKGNHAIQVGGNWQRIKVNPYNYEATIPTVNTGFSATAPASAQLSSAMFPGGISAADLGTANTMLAMLTGTITSVTQTFQVKDQNSGYVPGYYNSRYFTLNNIAAYAQDNWRWKPNFTVRYGLKWEYYSPLKEDGNLGFLPVLNGQDYKSVLLSPASTVSFINGGMYNADKNNFGPTVGFAWDVFKDGRTSVRGGYSLTFVNEETITVGQASINGNAGLSSAVSNANLYTHYADGVPMPATPTFKSTRTLPDQMALSNVAPMRTIDPNITQPRVHQVSVGISRELKWGFAGEARYVGTFGRDIWKGVDYNQIVIPQAFLDDFGRARSNGFLSQAAGLGFNPAYNASVPGSQPLTVIPNYNGGSLTNSTVRNYISQNEVAGLADFYVTSRVPSAYTSFLPNSGIYESTAILNGGWQNYHALQLEARRQMRSGLMGSVNYSYSHTRANGGQNNQNRIEAYLDNARPQLDTGRSLWNITHNINANLIYELPFGAGKKFLNKGGVTNAIVGNWQTAWIIHYQSGSPLSLLSTRGTFNRPGRSGFSGTLYTTLSAAELQNAMKVTKMPDGRIYWIDPSYVDPATGRGVGADNLGNTAGFAGQVLFNPAAGQVGNLEILAFDAPSVWSIDLALSKRFRFGRRYNLEVRGEAFNLLNHTCFYTGDMNVNSTTFGRLTGTATGARVIQLGARFDF
jgi:hypothetical protein